MPELALLPVSFLLGFLFFSYMVWSRWRSWLWLRGWGERLAFFAWPRPPWRVVRLTFLDGSQQLIYNPKIEEYRDGAEIETPWGIVRVPELAKTVLPMTAIFLHGMPNPMSLVIYTMSGLIAMWLSYYYGYLLLGYEATETFALISVILMLYIYAWYQAASTSGVEYHEYEVRGLSPPAIHAVPSSSMVGPMKAAKYWNTPIHIRISRQAKTALYRIKDALGVKDVNEAASILAKAEFMETILQKSVDLKQTAKRVEEALESMVRLRVYTGRITLGRTVLMIIVFALGIIIGWALSGGSVVVVPSHVVENATHAASTVVHNATMGVAGP